MKKLSIILALTMVLGLMTSGALAAPYFDVSTSADCPATGTTVSIDVEIKDMPGTDFWGYTMCVLYDSTKVSFSSASVLPSAGGCTLAPPSVFDDGAGCLMLGGGKSAGTTCSYAGDMLLATVVFTNDSATTADDTEICFAIDCASSDPGGCSWDLGAGTGAFIDDDQGRESSMPRVCGDICKPLPCMLSITPGDQSPVAPDAVIDFDADISAGGACPGANHVFSDTTAGGCQGGSIDSVTGVFTAASSFPVSPEVCTVCVTDTVNQDACTDGGPCCSDVTLVTPAGCATKILLGRECELTPPATQYNRPGRRELSITCCEEETVCICSSCPDPETCFVWDVEIVAGSDPDFLLTDLVDSTGTGETFTIKVKDPCNDFCPDEPVTLTVNVEAYECTGTPTGIPSDSITVNIGAVVLGVGSTNAHPDSQTADVCITLNNTENHVRAIQTDICSCEKEKCESYGTEDSCTNVTCGTLYSDAGPCNADPDCAWATIGGVEQCANIANCAWTGSECIAQDNLVCTECIIDEDRTPEYVCSASEQADGCCRVVIYSTEPDDLIQQGEGCVAMVKFDVLGEKTSKDCMCLEPVDSKVSDQFNEFLCACTEQGEICFRICGDVYPQDCYQCESCGDGVVDIFDILEEIDIILGLQTPSLCQQMCFHGDVPIGMPPYCGPEGGEIPAICDPPAACDGEIDIFDALVIIDKALSKMNCCDYCMYGEIYQ